MLPFPLKDKLKVEDIFLESVILMATLVVFISLWKLLLRYKHNKNWVVAVIGIGLYFIGAALDLLDEFWELPDFFPRLVENGLLALGISLFSLGNVIIVRQLINMANTDPMTGLYNKNYFYQTFEYEMDRALRHNLSLSIIFLDLDGFKDVNDRMGHKTGDLALVKIAKKLEATVRSTDILARYRGDEFVVLMPNTGASEAESVLNRIKEVVCELDMPVKLNVSGGIASCPEDSKDMDQLINIADKRMYTNKVRTYECQDKHIRVTFVNL